MQLFFHLFHNTQQNTAPTYKIAKILILQQFKYKDVKYMKAKQNQMLGVQQSTREQYDGQNFNNYIVMTMSSYFCEQGYCPHLHFKKCQNTRLQSIALSIFPDTSVDTYTNIPTKSANQYKSNIDTVAYENYTKQLGASTRQTNFVKHYYYSNQTASEPFSNTIVQDLQDDMATRNAYVLAATESTKFKEEQKAKLIQIENARRKSKAKNNEYYKMQEEEKKTKKVENENWLKKLYRKLEEVARHIIDGEAGTLANGQKTILVSKTNLTTPLSLSQMKVIDPKMAYQMLEQLRMLMLKKKKKFDQQRQEQDYNKEMTGSFVSDTQFSTNQQNSMISEATSVNQKTFDEEQAANKYCDFEALKKKWKCQDVESIKKIIRRVLTNEVLREAEVKATRKRREEEKSKNNVAKSAPKPKKPEKKKVKKGQKVEKQVKKQLVVPKSTLNNEEQNVKLELASVGQFDAAGERFNRTRNYSQMFKKREQENLVDFCIKQKTLQLTRDCCCPGS